VNHRPPFRLCVSAFLSNQYCSRPTRAFRSPRLDRSIGARPDTYTNRSKHINQEAHLLQESDVDVELSQGVRVDGGEGSNGFQDRLQGGLQFFRERKKK